MIFPICLLFLSISFFQVDKVNASSQEDGELSDFVKFFDDINFEGESWEFSYSELSDCGCTKLGDASGRASSIQTNEHCIVLFERPICVGKRFRIEADGSGRKDLRDWSFNDRATAMRSCECDDRFTGRNYPPLVYGLQ